MIIMKIITRSLFQLTFVFTLFTLVTISRALGIVDPEIKWETITTPHFEVIFDAKHYETAKKYALRLEYNHRVLMGYYEESPKKTIVVINDNTDMANGYATPIPYPHMMLFPVLPTSHNTVSEYSDWPQELTLHEYVHILNFTPAHGMMGLLRSGLGTIVTPTVLLPRWWHEGVAVEMETRFSTHGRLRSLYQDATLRALVKTRQLQLYSVADINESDLDSWPRGGRPYLFGSLILSEIQNQKKGTIHQTLLKRFSRRVPYFNNAPTEEETGRTFEEWFQTALLHLDKTVQEQLIKIREMPTTEFTPISSNFLESYSPQLSPNGRYFTFIARNKWGKSSIQIFDRKEHGRNFDLKADSISEFLSIDNKSEGEKKDAPPPGNINRIAWLPDSSGFIFDQIRFVDSYSNFSDLFLYDLVNKKNKRLTTGLRLRDPSLSPDATHIAAIQLSQSDTRLVLLASNGSDLTILYSPPSFHKIANPLFTDANDIYFTERNLAGHVLLQKINRITKEITSIPLNGITQIDSLSMEPGGISFVAHENGMQNLYWTENYFQSFVRITHTETAVFDGRIDQRTQTVYTTLMTEAGLQVATSTWPQNGFKLSPPLIKPLFHDRYDAKLATAPTEAELEREFSPLLQERKPYSSLKYLYPRYWFPFIYSSETGYGFQISTAVFDPLEKHSYGLDLSFDSYNKETTGSINYKNTTTTWPFSLSFLSQTRKQPLLDSDYESQQVHALATHDLRPFSENMTLGLGLNALGTKTPAIRHKAGPQLVYLYDGAAKSVYSKKPFAGYQFSLMGNHYVKTKELSSLTQALARASYFYSRHLPFQHIASFHLMAQEMEGELSLTDFSPSDTYAINPNQLFPSFILRGYDPGYFYIKQARSASFEYTFPLTGHRGWGTLPVFFKRTYVNLYADLLALDGIYSHLKDQTYYRTYLKNSFRSYGFELKGDLTLGYYLPLTLLTGLYHRPDYSNEGKTTFFVGIQL